MPNHLVGQSSPYLLQHAGNPVNWYPWGPEAFGCARDEDKPIFLSIGYSACHWCHVMERESFTDQQTAEFLNAHFVSIKVDREERPDLDAIYMQAVTALTGHGGWPLSVWLTPEGAPFYGGTYFPPSRRPGMPSFREVLETVTRIWSERRDELMREAETVVEHLKRESTALGLTSSREEELAMADTALQASFDPLHGGWGGAPKFPQPLVLEYLLARQMIVPRPDTQIQIETTLDAMAAGGIYDHLGGGFHRYSTDESWLVPHFEKMLYDNAQLARAYLHAWQATAKPRYREVAQGTLDYVLRRMTHPQGGFFSSEDADSAGVEGAFYVWTVEQVREVLNAEEAERVMAVFGMDARGNFEGANVLHLAAGQREDVSALAASRARLLRTREERLPPGRDEKILTGWNGLALAALAKAARGFESERYREAAVKAGGFIARELTQAGNRLAHSWIDGHVSGSGFLEDYTSAIDGLLELYQATFAECWFTMARNFTDTMIEYFRHPNGGFYDTSADHEALIVRPRSLQDSPVASGNSLAATILFKMAAYTGEDNYRSLAEETLSSASALVPEAPVFFGQWLSANLLAETGLTEIAIVGDLTHPRAEALLKVIDASFRPTVVMAAREKSAETLVPLLGGREPHPDAKVEAWVCRRSTCGAPTAEPDELRGLLNRPAP